MVQIMSQVASWCLYLSESWGGGNTIKPEAKVCFPSSLLLLTCLETVFHIVWFKDTYPSVKSGKNTDSLLPHDMQPRPVWCDLCGTDVKLFTITQYLNYPWQHTKMIIICWQSFNYSTSGCVCITHPGVSLSVDLDLDCFVFKYIATIAIYSFSGTIFTHSVSTFPERLSGPENEAKQLLLRVKLMVGKTWLILSMRVWIYILLQ